jgi:hypothetical protein
MAEGSGVTRASAGPRRVAIPLVLLAVALLPGLARADTPTGGLGVNGQELLWTLPKSDWTPNLARMQADGVRTVRADAFWSSVEPQPPDSAGHHYQWNSTDAIAAALARYGLRWLPIADYSTWWAASVNELGQPQLHSPPRNADDFAAYAGALVARYGSSGSFWAQHPELQAQPIQAVEVWNEPNASWAWYPQPDPARYAQLYEATRTAIHAVDARIAVIVGGLSKPASDFLDRLYAVLGGAGHLDAVALHPYANNASEVVANVASARANLDSHGDANVPIDVTEFGWPTRGNATWIATLSDPERAAQLSQVIQTLAAADCGVERILPQTWASPEADLNNSEDWFGIVSPDGTPHVSATALANTLHTLENAPSPAHAAISVCNRPLSLGLTSVSQRASPSVAAAPRTPLRRRHHRRRTRAHKHHRRKAAPAPVSPARGAVCLQSLVTTASTPVPGATVMFAITDRSARGPAGATAVTDATGHATACFTDLAVGPASVQATAEDPHFVPVPSSTMGVVVG